MFSVSISYLNELKLSKNLSIYDTELVIHGLVENHVVDMLVQWVTRQSKTANSILFNDFQKFIDFLWGICEFLYQNFEEFNNFWIVIVNTKIEAVEESHWILFDVRIMLTNN